MAATRMGLVVRGRAAATAAILLVGGAVWWPFASGPAEVVPVAHEGLAWSPTFGIESGQPAHIDAPGLVAWAIPSSRQEFDLYRLVADLADDDALEIAFAVTDWVAVADRQVVRRPTVQEVENLLG